ncbi:Endonuclease/exonuclease/phosphatase [Aspergillus filifer]
MTGTDAPPTEVNILTLNCWGIPCVSPEYSRRLAEIGRHIAQADPEPHIVGLQECFSRNDFERIWQETRQILPYAKHYSAGPFGTGLAILSRWPIEETSMIRYPLNGYPSAFYHGDWYVGKGVACATIRYGEASDNVISVLNTHMHAYYSTKNDYLCHRVSQAWEFAKLLQAASQRHRGRALVIGLGDLNAEPHSLPWRILKHRAPEIYDTWLASHLRNGLPPECGEQIGCGKSRSVNIQTGATYGSPHNTWQWTRNQRIRYLATQPGTPTREPILPPELDHSQAVRIDYVLASVAHEPLNTAPLEVICEPGTQNTTVARRDGVWVVKAAKVGMRDRHPTIGCSLSDHFSVEVTLAFRAQQKVLLDNGVPTRSGQDVPTKSRQTTLGDVHVQDANGVSANFTVASENLIPVDDAERTLNEVLRVIDDYKLVRQRVVWWGKVRSGVAGTVLVGSLIGLWVVDGFGWARLLLGTAGAFASAFAMLDGYAGLMFNLAEAAALRELAWDVNNVKDRGSNDLGSGSP